MWAFIGCCGPGRVYRTEGASRGVIVEGIQCGEMEDWSPCLERRFASR